MARRRYISTDISLDGAISDLYEQHGAFAALLYTWMIPHTEDDATLHGTPKELVRRIMPERGVKPGQIEAALLGMQELGLITWDPDQAAIYFPTSSFYKYQTYIPGSKRRSEDQRTSDNNSEQQRKTPQNAEDNNLSLITAQNTASPSPSLSPSNTEEEEEVLTNPDNVPDPEPDQAEFNRLAFTVWGTTLTAAQEIEDYIQATSAAVLYEALKETVSNATRSRLAYLRKTMIAWQEAGVKTLADVDAIRSAYRVGKQGRASPPEPTEEDVEEALRKLRSPASEVA